MSFKICFIGAGSLGFTRQLVRDILTVKELQDIEIAFTDINEEYLNMAAEVVQRDICENGLKIKIFSSINRREALKGSKYVFNCVRIGGIEASRMDIEIPLKYGITQCYGDTLCAGGIMYGQRSIAAVLDFCRDIREVCHPDCIMLNYANPNAMITWAANKYGKVRTIGLCHGVMYGRWQIAEALGLKQEELDIICAGINHMTWYIQVKHKGEDVSGKILQAFENHPRFSKTEKIRIDMMKRFGYYVTESNSHASEYISWYRKRIDEVDEWLNCSGIVPNIACGDTGAYLLDILEERERFEKECQDLKTAPIFNYTPENRGLEHGSYIIESLETGRIYRGHFNVVNNGTISNLPVDAVVEVPGYVDANGINIPRVGDLPLGCASACNSNIAVQRLSVEAAAKGDDMLLRQAMMMDPLTGAICNPPEIWQLVDEMLVAEAQWLPQYKASIIEEARERLKSNNLIKPREYRGTVREKYTTIEDLMEKRLLYRAEKARLEAEMRQDAGSSDKINSGGMEELLKHTGFKNS